jgi:excisionase family DNA binding protein
MAITSRGVPSRTAQADNDSTGRDDPSVPAHDEFLTVGDVAVRLRVHPQTVRAWIARGDLRAIRNGRTVRVGQTDFRRCWSARGSRRQVIRRTLIRAVVQA